MFTVIFAILIVGVDGQFPRNFRVLSLNTWNCGTNVNNGLSKIVRHIKIVNPDVVALQEVNARCAGDLLGQLGSTWSGAVAGNGPNVPGLISHHSIDLASCTNVACSIAIGCEMRVADFAPKISSKPEPPPFFVKRRQKRASDGVVRVWSAHFDPNEYGPYDLCVLNRTVTSNLRSNNWLTLRSSPDFSRHLSDAVNRAVPLVLAGDFNEPSYLDWGLNTKHHHCNRVKEWWVSRVMQTDGFRDAYRIVRPDAAADQGITWSTVQKTTDSWGPKLVLPEPQDRIDIVHYITGTPLNPVNAFTYQGDANILPKPWVSNNDWPSDHFGVVVDFRLD